MEVVIDYEYLTGARGEDVPKDVPVASENVIDTFRFLLPYSMNPHSSERSGLTWDEEIISYSSLFQTLTEATYNFVHLYPKGHAKCAYLFGLLGRTVQSLDSLAALHLNNLELLQVVECHAMFPDKSCSLRNAINLYGWLKPHIQDKEFVKCINDTRHTAVLNSGVETE
jgi:hypothetical protein